MAIVDTGAVVVHHNRYDSVPRVVRELIREGVPADLIVVVDNSGHPDRRAELIQSMPPEVRTEFVPNGGYGAAVNHGVRRLLGSHDLEYIVVATHEVVISDDTVSELHRALEADPNAAAAGPTLTSPDGSTTVIWSRGGYLSRVAGIPLHHGHRAPQDGSLDAAGSHPQRRRWLDGAFVLYRAAELARLQFHEPYFLYMEEVDLHLRLGASGRAVLWVPKASVEQSSDGIPLYYFARNLLILNRRTGSSLHLATLPAVIAKRTLRDIIKTKSAAPLSTALRGLIDGLRTR